MTTRTNKQNGASSVGRIETAAKINFNMIFGIPEMWLSGSVKEMLSSKFFRRNLVCVVVDEAHKVAW